MHGRGSPESLELGLLQRIVKNLASLQEVEELDDL